MGPFPGAPPLRRPVRPPPTPETLGVVGGLVIAAVGALLAASYAGSPSLQTFLPTAWGVALGILGVLTGVAIVALVAIIHRRPSRHLVGGALIVLLSIISLIVTSGGLVVGFVLALVGGLWLFAWTPSAATPGAESTVLRPAE